MYLPVVDLAGIKTDIIRVPRKNKRRKTPDTSIIRKQYIQELVNPIKMEKENTLTDLEKSIPKEKPPYFWHKLD